MWNCANLEGEVTDLNENLLTFEVNNKTTVHMVLMYPTCFPEKGSQVKVSSPYFYSQGVSIAAMVLNPVESVLDGNLNVQLVFNTFIQLVQELDVKAADLLQFAKNCHKLKTKQIPHDDLENVMYFILEKLRNAKFELRFISEMQYFNPYPESYDKKFSYFTFGTHWNWTKTQYLFGKLFVWGKNNMVYFTDFKEKLPCLIQATPDLVNCYVIIKDYTIITEIYKCNKFQTMKYLYVDPNKIIRLDVADPVPIFPLEADLLSCNFMKTSYRIVSKSMATATSVVDVANWLDVVENERQRFFLCVKGECGHVVPFLKPGHFYSVYYQTAPQPVFNKEISYANSSLPQKQTSVIYFIPTDAPASPSKILDVIEAKKKLQSHSSDLISFQGVISVKIFNRPLGSRTSPVTSDSTFGTPGTETPTVRFELDGQSITLFLNNWENLAMPFGLIPNVRVIVRNVKPQRDYFKSTGMTSLEVVSYEPKMRVETANLCGFRWGHPFFLGAGCSISNGTIIWGKVLSLFVLGLKINNNPNPKPDEECLNVNITIITFDQLGESKVIASDNPGYVLLRLLFGMHEQSFPSWTKALTLLNGFTYSKGAAMAEEPDEKKKFIKDMMTKHLESLENRRLQLELTCRKMNDDVDGTKAVFCLLDAASSN